MELELSPYALTMLVLLIVVIVWIVLDKIKNRGSYQRQQAESVQLAREETEELKASLPDDPQAHRPRPREDRWYHQKDSSKWL